MIVLVSGIALLPTAASAASASAETASGRWGVLVADHVGLCLGRGSAWTWTTNSDAGGSKVSYINSSGKVIAGPWTLPIEVATVSATKDCSVAWFLDADGEHLYVLDRTIAPGPQSLGQGLEVSHGVSGLYAADDGIHAWLSFYSDSQPDAVIQRTPSGLKLRQPAGLRAIQPQSALAYTFQGRGEWIVPHGRGLWLTDFERAHPIKALANVDVDSVVAGSDRRIAWIVPTHAGLLLVDYRGNVLRHEGRSDLLPNEDVTSITTEVRGMVTTDYAWAITDAHRLYVFRVQIRGDGSFEFQRLNQGHPIALGLAGSSIYAVDLRLVGDGRQAWVLAAPSAYSGKWTSTYYVALDSHGIAKCIPLQPYLYHYKTPRALFVDSRAPFVLWLRTSDYSIYEIHWQSGRVIANPFKALPISTISVADVRGRLWLETALGEYLVGPADDLLAGSQIEIGSDRLGPAGSALHHQLFGALARVTLARPVTVPLSGQVRLAVTAAQQRESAGGAGAIASGEAPLSGNGTATISLLVRDRMNPMHRYDIHLSYTDGSVFDAKLRWSGVELKAPWYEWPYVRAMGLVLVPIVLLLVSLHPSLAMRRWVPIGIPLIEISVNRMAPTLLAAGTSELLVVALATFGLTLVIALLSPPLLRAIAAVHPYRLLVPILLQLPVVRRRYFAQYLAELERSLNRVRAAASNELFVDLPCQVLESAIDAHPPGSTVFATDLAKLGMADDPLARVSLLIDAPGGRGKSALLNECVARAIAAFKEDASHPLPLLIDARSATVESLVNAALGRHRLSDDFATQHLDMGDFVLFVDGLSEGTTDCAAFESLFLRSNAGERTRVLATARPAPKWRATFKKADRWIIVSPQRLTDHTVDQFVDRYLQAAGDPPVGCESPQPERGGYRIARASDGTYLPLLVRFAMLADDERLNSLRDLYAATLERLLRSAGSMQDLQHLVEAAEELAYETYWEAGARLFTFDRGNIEKTEDVRKLLDVGLLIDADASSSRLVGHPRTARFIHDSMQSYLVARTLLRRRDCESLVQAAGDARFNSAAFEAGGSELFELCLDVFSPRAELRPFLRARLRSWASEYSLVLSIAQIQSALDPQIIARADREFSRDISSGKYLEMVIDLVPHDGERDLKLLGDLFAALARVIWPIQTVPAKGAV